MSTLTAPLTKEQERALLLKTVAGLPDGYVRDILVDAMPEMEQAITSDFGYIPIKLRMSQMAEYAKDIKSGGEHDHPHLSHP